MKTIPSCCALLASQLPQLISFPNSTAYNALEASYWSAQEAELQPACAFTPQHAGDVARAMAWLNNTRDCPFAIKSGGHAPHAGFANIDGGVTVDLSGIQDITLGADGQSVRVGSGATWLQVYAALDPHHLTAAGGRNGQVGVGGYLLGGGISYIGPRVGWGCDTLLGTEIVVASGQIVHATAATHPDLLRALKGGGNNFGIITHFELRTFAQGDMLAGKIISPFTQRSAVCDAFASLAAAKPYDPFAESVTSFAYAPGSGWQPITSLAAYTKAQSHPPAAFQPFLAVPQTNSSLHLTNISAYADEPPIPQFRELFATGTYGISSHLMQRMLLRWQKILASKPAIPGLLAWGFAFEPLPTVFTQWGDRNGGNVLGTEPAQLGDAMILLISATWTNASTDDRVAHGRLYELIGAAHDEASRLGLARGFQYMNYADLDFQEPFRSYNASNLAFLQRQRQVWDPTDVFQTGCPGGFKLPVAS